MDRLTQSTRTRPTSSLFSPASTSHLGKRGATEAGIDDTYALQKTNRELQSRLDTLTRRNQVLVSSEQGLLREVQDLKADNEVLRQNRASLVDRTKADGSLSEGREKAWKEERAQLQSDLTAVKTRFNRTREENERLQSEYPQLTHKVANLEQISKPLPELYDQIKELRNQNKELQSWRGRAQALSINLEEEKRRNQMQTRAEKDQKEDEGGEKMYRQEMARQKETMSSLNHRIHQVEAENIQLKQAKQEWDHSVRSYMSKEVEMRDEIRVLHDQLERARRDMDSVTQSFPLDQTPEESAATLQAKLLSLSSLHQQATVELATKESEIAKLHTRLTDTSNSSQSLISELTKKMTELERELRWAKQGREAAEKSEARAKKELDSYYQYQDTGSQGMPGGLQSSDQSARIRQLEHLVKEYKSELESISRDSRDLESKIAQGHGLVSSALLEEANSLISTHESTIKSLETTLAELQSANTTLDAEVNDLMRRVASGEYNPKTERIVELQNNPAAKVMAVRTQILEDLKKENEVLIQRLRSSGGDGGEGSIPRESWERLVKEKEELEKAHAKRLMRLKEIFSSKSKEFLEAVYSLLGWRIKFDESGTDIRLTSMYAPKGKMGLTLKFTSQEGHFGTMQMTGGMSRGLEDVRTFWIGERQSVPGFLAQVTTEMFEKTTMGRGAGYVGLE